MKKYVLWIYVLIIISAFLVGCAPETTPATKEDTQTPVQAGQQQIEEKPVESVETCSDECSEDRCDGVRYISCLSGDDGCKKEGNGGLVKGKCGIDCLDDSDCQTGHECEGYKCVEKPNELEDTGSDLTDSLRNLRDSLEEINTRNNKLDECTRACAGDDYDIPMIKDEFYLFCYEIYYALGVGGLDEEIERCKNE